MAHRIYIYNIDSTSGEHYPNYLGEWNYVLPPLLIPLFGVNNKAKGTQLYADREQGIVLLRQFYNLLADEYQLHYKKAYYEPVNGLFTFLEALPYDKFSIDGTDVFHMKEEKHSVQVKEWVVEIQEQIKLYQLAIASQSLAPLQELLETFGYKTFLEALETDWINYGLGYWNEEAYKHNYTEIFEENNLKGLKDAKGNCIVPAIYNEIFEFIDGIAVIQKDNKFGYLNTQGTELVPPLYEEAFDAFKIYYGEIINYDYTFEQKVGTVSCNNIFGLLDITKNQLLIPIVYEELEHIFGDYFNAKKDNQYLFINHKNEQLIKEESETPFEFEGVELFFSKIKGSSKRKYFNANGVFIGEYVEDELQTLPHLFFYVKPNKGQKKTEIIQANGELLDTDIDQIITLSGYQSFAYRKAKKWFLFDTLNHKLCLAEFDIQKIKIDYLANFFQDVYIIETSLDKGVFDAKNDCWLLHPHTDYLKIEHLQKHYLSVHQKEGVHYWDGEINLLSPRYDYISEAINLETDKLFLYQNEELLCLNSKKEIRKVADEEIGKLYNRRYNLRGKDLAHFDQFYEQWKSNIGQDYFQYFDDDSLFQLGVDFFKANKTEEGIAVYKLGASRNHPEMMTELAIIYSNTEETLHANLPLAIDLYKKAATLGERNAWNNLGYHYQNGIGIEQNITKAIEAYSKAGELKNRLGWSNLGDLYYYGELVEQDYDKALEYYLKAQKLYQFNSDKITDIYFTQEDYKKVLPLLKKDREEEFSPIYYGLMYEQGLGGLKLNLKKAISYYENAMEINHYPHAVKQLLYHYRAASDLANEVLFNAWLHYAEVNEIEIDRELLGLEPPKKESFFKKIFKK
ncbi:SEL1-like repeat protein [Sphingobacterium sp. SG20118]|uniref:SEL1-like repeat protein n=1 Tax=Sphingobacterium sp. SG20118 TaxID=3367156 RepID=UPI0037DFC1D9